MDRVHEGVLRVHLTAPAEQGKANAALVTLLAELMGVRRSQVEILAGLANRNKVVRIRGVTPGQIASTMSASWETAD